MRANHKGNIKFPNPLLLPRSISNNERGRTKAIDKNLDTLNPKVVCLHHKRLSNKIRQVILAHDKNKFNIDPNILLPLLFGNFLLDKTEGESKSYMDPFLAPLST